MYVDNRGTEKGAPAGLCYPVVDTSREAVGRQHGDAILAPGERRQLTIDLTARYLRELRFGSKTLQVSDRPYEREERVFALPDLRFGNGAMLRAQDDLSNFSKRRSQLLRERSVGSYTKGPFDRQDASAASEINRRFVRAAIPVGSQSFGGGDHWARGAIRTTGRRLR